MEDELREDTQSGTGALNRGDEAKARGSRGEGRDQSELLRLQTGSVESLEYLGQTLGEMDHLKRTAESQQGGCGADKVAEGEGDLLTGAGPTCIRGRRA